MSQDTGIRSQKTSRSRDIIPAKLHDPGGSYDIDAYSVGISFPQRQRVPRLHGRSRRRSALHLFRNAASRAQFRRRSAASRHCPGDRIAVLARNGVLPLEAHFAVPLIGAVLVPLNIRLQAGELATILNHSGARILLGDADLLAPLLARVRRFHRSSGSSPITSLSSARAVSPWRRIRRAKRM
jgi:long-subunit acyl-CoA synthetase (AMP-forming)